MTVQRAPPPPPSDTPRTLALSRAEIRSINRRHPPLLPYTHFQLSPTAPAGALLPLSRLAAVHEHYRAAYEPALAAAHAGVVRFRQYAWAQMFDRAGRGAGLGAAEAACRAAERGGKSPGELVLLERRSRAARALKRIGIHPVSVARASRLREATFPDEEESEEPPEQPVAAVAPTPRAKANPRPNPTPDPIIFVGAFFELCDRTLPTRAPRRQPRSRSNALPPPEGAAEPAVAKRFAAPRKSSGRPRAPTVPAAVRDCDSHDRGPWRKSQLARQLDLLSEQLALLAVTRRSRKRAPRQWTAATATAAPVPVV